MKNRTIIGLDPGGSTGWTVLSREGVWWGGTFDTPNHHAELFAFLIDGLTTATEKDHELQVVCERFNYQRRELDKGVGLELISRNYIGVVELFCFKYDVPLYMSQVPNKDFWTDKNLKTLELWAHRSPHERDAIRHVLWYVTFVEKDPEYVRFAKGPK